MLGRELALSSSGWRKWVYACFGTLDLDTWIWFWHFRRFFFPYVKNMESGKLLDAGCGEGIWSFYLAQQNLQIEVEGVDIRVDVVERSQEIATTMKIPNLRFNASSFLAFEYYENFDIVMSIFSLHYSYEQDVEVLTKFQQALRTDGRLLLAVPAARGMRNSREQYDGDSEQTRYGIPVVMDKFLDHYYPEELIEKLGEAGFTDVEIKPIVGRLGQWGKELYTMGDKRILLKAVVWPIVFLMGWLDSLLSPKFGLVYLVRAGKSEV